jgi:cell division protein ZapA
MSPDPREKKPVRVSVYNQDFTLLVAGSDAATELEEAANEVDELMSTIARSGNMDATRVAVLACLHLQDRVRTLEREFAQMKSRVEDRTRKLADLLDTAVDSVGESAD